MDSELPAETLSGTKIKKTYKKAATRNRFSKTSFFEILNNAFYGGKIGENRIGKISYVIISERSKEQCKEQNEATHETLWWFSLSSFKKQNLISNMLGYLAFRVLELSSTHTYESELNVIQPNSENVEIHY